MTAITSDFNIQTDHISAIDDVLALCLSLKAQTVKVCVRPKEKQTKQGGHFGPLPTRMMASDATRRKESCRR